MSIWITRPIDDAERMAALMLSKGLTPLVSPLLHVDFPCPDLGTVPAKIGGLVATSRNGLRGAAVTSFSPTWLDLPLFTVGEASADLARRFGFRNIHVGEGRAASVPKLIEKTGLNPAIPLVHFCGDEQAFDLSAALEPLGFTLVQLQTYKIVEAERLTDKLIIQVRTGEVCGVVLMSPRTARLYIRLLDEAGLGAYLKTLNHFCLSDAVAEALIEYYKSVGGEGAVSEDLPLFVAPATSLEALIDMIKRGDA
jgi:uroporphyrinogen-III synthase